MHGQAVPLVMIPRYTSYVGAGSFSTAPLLVSDYDTAYLTLWRGQILKYYDPTYTRTFTAKFQVSHDAVAWTDKATVTTVNAVSNHEIDLSMRWFRILVTLTDGGDPSDHTVGITCWATGLLEKRIK